MSKDQKEYQKAQLAMLDWVDACRVNGVGVDMVSIILLEEAVEIVLKEARAMKEDGCCEAADVVEDFFVNNVFDGTGGKKMTLHKLNFTHRAWMELSPDAPESEKQIVFAQMRDNPKEYLSGSLKYGFGIIVNGMPLWAEARPVAEAIEAAKEMGIQTRFAWSAPKWIELEAKQ